MLQEASIPNSIKWTFIAPILIAVAILCGCQKKQAFTPPPLPAVTVSFPLEQIVTDYDRFTGVTEAVESVEVRARVEGYLESILFDDSDIVNKGDLLAVIDPKPFQAKLDLAEADLMLNKAELSLCETTLRLKEDALKDNAVSEIEVIEVRARKDKAEAAVEASRAAVRTARLNLSYTRIEAPITGKIGRNLVDAGNLVGAGERTLLATIIREDPIYAYFNLSEKEFLSRRQNFGLKQTQTNGQSEVTVSLGLANEAGYPHAGHIDYVNNRVNADSGVIQVRAIFPNSTGEMVPGLFARIQIPISEPHTAMLVPERALGADQVGRFLLVIDKDNVVAYKSVKFGDKVGDFRIIESGITFEDRVIVNGVQRARPGAVVNPMEANIKQAHQTATEKMEDR